MPKVDTDIPMPKPDGRGLYSRSKWVALFKGMRRGHSVTLGTKEYRAARMSLYCGGIPIVTRKEGTGFRIWKAQ